MDRVKFPGTEVTFITKWNICLTNYIRFLPRLLRYPSLVNVMPLLVFWAGIVPSDNKTKHDMTLQNKSFNSIQQCFNVYLNIGNTYIYTIYQNTYVVLVTYSHKTILHNTSCRHFDNINNAESNSHSSCQRLSKMKRSILMRNDFSTAFPSSTSFAIWLYFAA